MSIIEQAAKRLAALNRAGVALPVSGFDAVPPPVRLETKPRRAFDEVESLRRAPLDPAPEHGERLERVADVQIVPSPLRPLRPLRQVTLDLAQLERSGHAVSAESRSLVAQEFRGIKRPLLKNARSRGAEKRLSLIMVSSALPGEGKTFCAINLALSMAIEIETSVLLVDADVVRPDVMGRLGVQAGTGLLDLLADPRIDLSDVLLQTNVPKLAILPPGTPSSRATELLASPATERLLDELCDRYGVVVFDAPPLLVTTEAGVLASRVGQVLLVVEAKRTPRNAVEQAFAAVAQCPVVMSVLNKGPEPMPYNGYRDYYG
jgi:receptor protein-tyrosine kinase